jgi:hypothetical protein
VVFAIDIAEIRLEAEHGTATAAAAEPPRATIPPAAAPTTVTLATAIRNE